MGKRIIITAGSTREKLDVVMVIDNMSTGALGCTMAETLLGDRGEEIDKIYYISPKMAYKPRVQSEKVELVTVETTQDLIEALEKIFATDKIDIIIHSSAVGDYKGKYVIRAEDLVDEIWQTIQSAQDKDALTKEALMGIFENPTVVCDNST